MSYTSKGERRFVNCTLSGPVEVYVKNDRIVRVLPLARFLLYNVHAALQRVHIHKTNERGDTA